jgi:hypothetical protein
LRRAAEKHASAQTPPQDVEETNEKEDLTLKANGDVAKEGDPKIAGGSGENPESHNCALCDRSSNN